MQTRAAAVLQSRRDAVIQSETGSGKTMSFLMPVLSQLDYPPDLPLSEFQACRIPHMECSRASIPLLLSNHLILLLWLASQCVCLVAAAQGSGLVQRAEWPF